MGAVGAAGVSLHFFRLKIQFSIFKIQLFIPTSNDEFMYRVYARRNLRPKYSCFDSDSQESAEPRKAGGQE